MPEHEQQQPLLTIHDVASRFKVGTHQIRYAIETRGIQPTQRVGGTKAFDNAAVELIRAALTEIGRNAHGINQQPTVYC